MTKLIHPNTKEAKIKFGNIEIDCAVLEDGTRVLSQRAVSKALGSKRGGAHWQRIKQAPDEVGAKLPVFISSPPLKPFIDKELEMALISPIPYRAAKGGQVAYGVLAELLPKICEVWLRAIRTTIR